MNNTEKANYVIKRSQALGRLKPSSYEPTESSIAANKLAELHNKMMLDIAKQMDDEAEFRPLRVILVSEVKKK